MAALWVPTAVSAPPLSLSLFCHGTYTVESSSRFTLAHAPLLGPEGNRSLKHLVNRTLAVRKKLMPRWLLLPFSPCLTQVPSTVGLILPTPVNTIKIIPQGRPRGLSRSRKVESSETCEGVSVTIAVSRVINIPQTASIYTGHRESYGRASGRAP